MTLTTAILLIPALHFVADFLLQSDWMALNKSKRFDALGIHVLVYSFLFTLVFGVAFGLVTFATHFATDAITSRITSKLWFIEMKPAPAPHPNDGWPYLAWVHPTSRHWFFVVIGVDQMIHMYTLMLTAYWVLS